MKSDELERFAELGEVTEDDAISIAGPLAKAYDSANWAWGYLGIPGRASVLSAIRMLMRDAVKESAMQTGGLRVENHDGRLLLLVDRKIAAKNSKLQSTLRKFTRNVAA